MGGRARLPKSVLGLAVAVVLLAALTFSVSAASSRNQTLRGTKPLHVTKDCSGSKGDVGGFCTIFYLQASGKNELNSDTAIYAGPGNIAAGHCLLHFATGLGLCTISDGTGTLAGFHARVRVTHDSSIPDLYHWDGTYSFSNG